MHPTSPSRDNTIVPEGAVEALEHAVDHDPVKRALVVVISVLLAVASGLLVHGRPGDAATGGSEVAKCGGGSVYLDAKEKQTFVRHNEIRRRHDLRPFCVHPALEQAARSHSEDMIERDYFSHDTKGRNETAGERIKRFGYTARGYSFYMTGENIAYGSGSYGAPDSVMRSWMRSAGHRQNILNRKFRQVGIGVSTGTWQGRKGVSMYTVDFGVRRR